MLNRGESWPEPIAIICMVTFTFIGAAVGAAANAVLSKPLGEIGAKTYRVTGPWAEPKVDVIDRDAAPKPAPAAPAR